MTTLDAGAVTLRNLFLGEKQYISPLFQRKYVWGKKEIDALWDGIDLILSGEDSERFLGALVLEVKSAGTAFKPDSSWIVDGQQRLTTLYITLIAIAKIAIGKKDLESFGVNIIEQYILNQGIKFKNTPKISPTITDFRQFNSLFDSFSNFVNVKNQQSYGDEKGEITKAFDFIEKHIIRRCTINSDFDYDVFENIAASILEKLAFVQIILAQEHNAHQVFDSLNSKGIKLENKDLIRNLVFEKLSEQPELAETIYQKKWLPLEESLGEHFDSYFFPFTLVEKSSATKSNLLATLRVRWKDKESYDIIEDLNSYVETYKSLVFYPDFDYKDLTNCSEINNQIMLLAKMRVPSSTYSFIFRIIKSYNSEAIDKDNVIKTLKIIESFLVRRSIAGFEPTGLHAIFKDLWNETKGLCDRVTHALSSKKTVQFPSDEQFSDDIKTKPLYGRKLAQYIILQYERSFNKGDTTDIDADFEIDHIMPNNLSGYWGKTLTHDQHQKYLDTWANLVPLTKNGNIQKSCKDWNEAKDYLGKESVFKSTRNVVELYKDWNEDSIISRSILISNWALNRWPRNL